MGTGWACKDVKKMLDYLKEEEKEFKSFMVSYDEHGPRNKTRAAFDRMKKTFENIYSLYSLNLIIEEEKRQCIQDLLESVNGMIQNNKNDSPNPIEELKLEGPVTSQIFNDMREAVKDILIDQEKKDQMIKGFFERIQQLISVRRAALTSAKKVEDKPNETQTEAALEKKSEFSSERAEEKKVEETIGQVEAEATKRKAEEKTAKSVPEKVDESGK